VASIPIRGGLSLRPAKKIKGSFDKFIDKNSPAIFTWQTTPLTKLPRFIFSPILTWQTIYTPLTLTPYFTFPYFSIYTLNKAALQFFYIFFLFFNLHR